jgi:hypothetical protein
MCLILKGDLFHIKLRIKVRNNGNIWNKMIENHIK